MTALARIRQALFALAAVFIIAVTGHRILTGGSWLSSVHYFVITVSGVGYSEVSDTPPELQLYSIFVILIGMFVVGYTITVLLQSMIEGQIYRALGIRRMTQEIEQLSGHTIICGLGRMGQTLAEEFAGREEPFVVIDGDSEKALAARADGMLIVTGDALEEESLIAAGIKRAKVFVAALHSDADNVFLTLTARNLNPQLRIISRGELPATEKKLRQAGADDVVLPAVIGARRMAAMVTRPHATELLDLMVSDKALRADLEEFTVGQDCPLTGQSIREVALQTNHHILLLGIRRPSGEMLFAPHADTKFTPGDSLIVLGKQGDLRLFRQAHGL